MDYLRRYWWGGLALAGDLSRRHINTRVFATLPFPSSNAHSGADGLGRGQGLPQPVQLPGHWLLSLGLDPWMSESQSGGWQLSVPAALPANASLTNPLKPPITLFALFSMNEGTRGKHTQAPSVFCKKRKRERKG